MNSIPHGLALRVHTDGSYCPQTGCIGIGVRIEKDGGDAGAALRDTSTIAGRGDSFDAELYALAEAARQVHDAKPESVEYCVDCKSLVDMLQRLRVSGRCKPRHKRVRRLARTIYDRPWPVVVTHVPRGENGAANQLARKALKTARAKRT